MYMAGVRCVTFTSTMPKSSSTLDETAILSAALEGLKLQKQKIDEQIQQVSARLGRLSGRKPVGRPAKKGKRVLSASARKRISMAQKKRWAQHRKQATKS